MPKSSSIYTFSGRWIDPLDPDPELIEPIDLAHSLSRVARFTGHTHGELYSVAQHCVHAYDIASPSNKLWALLHDGTEAYLADLVRPVKQDESMEKYREAENRLMAAICERFNLKMPIPREVKRIDDNLLSLELRDLLHLDFPNELRVDFQIQPWSWKVAKLHFAHRMTEQGIEVGTIVT